MSGSTSCPLGEYRFVCDDVVIERHDRTTIIRFDYGRWFWGPAISFAGVLGVLGYIHTIRPIPMHVVFATVVIGGFGLVCFWYLISHRQRALGPVCVINLGKELVEFPRESESVAIAAISNIQIISSWQSFTGDRWYIHEVNVVAEDGRRFHVFAMQGGSQARKLAEEIGRTLARPIESFRAGQVA